MHASIYKGLSCIHQQRSAVVRRGQGQVKNATNQPKSQFLWVNRGSFCDGAIRCPRSVFDCHPFQFRFDCVFMFDPYRKWLGILPKDQPPNHYRLLGIELYENDLDVIEGAADKQMGFVRQYQSGEHAADAAKILNELAIARLCLLKKATKSAYDEKLRQQLAPAPSQEEFPDLPPSFSDERPRSKSRKRNSKRGSPSALSQQSLMIGGGVGVACLLLAVFLFSRGANKPPPKIPDTANVVVTNPISPKVDVTPTRSTPSEVTQPSSFLWKESKLVTEPIGPPVDLLKLVDLKRDVVMGKWEQTETALIGESGSRIYLPVKLPEDYQLKYVVRRIQGTETLMLGFMIDGGQGAVALDGFGATVSGLLVDGRGENDNCTTHRGTVFQGQTGARVVLTVHPGHVHVSVDGRTIANWFGDRHRLFHWDAGWSLPCRESPYVITANAKYVIESASMVPIKPEPVPSRLARLSREFDVLPLMDAERDALKGIWGINKQTLLSPEAWGRIYLPTVVPEEYTVSATVELPASNQGNFDICVGLVAGTSVFQFVSGHGGAGLDAIDGRRFNDGETRSASLLKPGIPARIDCTVTKSGVRAEVDGKTVVDWRGDVRRLSIPGEWAMADSRRLFLGSTCHLKIRDLKLGPPLAAPKAPEQPRFTVGRPIDLLTLVDPQRDAFGGTWERDGTSLRCRGDVERNKLSIPVDVPDEYKLTMGVTRIEGGQQNNEALYVGLPIADSKAHLTFDGVRSTVSGAHLDSTNYGANALIYRGAVIPAGATREIVFLSRRTGLQVTSGSTKIFDWACNPDRFSVEIPWQTPGRRLTIGSFSQGFRFEKLELEPLPPNSFPDVPPLGADGKLLPILNVDRDSRRGDWKREGDSLLCPTSVGCRLRIPAKLPPSYVFSAVVERKQRNPQGTDLLFGLSVGTHPCSISIDGDNGHQAGIDLLDDKRLFDLKNLSNRKYKDPLLPLNQNIPVRCYVLSNAIVVTCGDKEVVRWHGDPRRL